MGLRQVKRGFRVGSTGRGREDEHRARDHAQKHGLCAAYHCARWRTRWSHNVIPVPELQQFAPGRLRLLRLWEKTTKWWCAICEEKYDWRQPSRLLVVQTGDCFEQAKVFKAHAVPQGLCANLINALNLLANQQEEWRWSPTEYPDEPR